MLSCSADSDEPEESHGRDSGDKTGSLLNHGKMTFLLIFTMIKAFHECYPC